MSVHPINNQLAGMKATQVNFGNGETIPKIWHLPTWKQGDETKRIAVLRDIAMRSGRDPRFATMCVNILKAHNIQPRDYKGQANALLKWVQHNIYYVNEPSERLQDPIYTLKVGYGDCDDMAILLATMYESIKLDWRYVLSGKVKGKDTRWIEGTPLPNGTWSHIYLLVGYPPFQPKKWQFAEPTLRGVDLGWDIIQSIENGERILPEMAGTDTVNNDEEQKFFDKIKERKEKLKEKFDIENIASDVIVASVVAVLTSKLVNLIEKNFFKKKKKK